MMNKYNFKNKSEIVTHSIVKCTDSTKGSANNTFYGKNDNKRSVLKIGPDLPFSKNEKRCDYLLITESDNAYFIELKGKNDAIAQLENSIRIVTNTNNNFTEKPFSGIKAYAVMNKYPKAETSTQNHKDRFKKHLKTKLIIATKQYTEELI